MKILFVITGLGLGGAETQVCLLAKNLKDEGHEVAIVSLTGINSLIPKDKTIPIYEIKMNKSPVGFMMGVFKLINVINSFNPEVVHSHMYHANIASRIVRLLSKPKYKLVCTAHSKNEGGKLRMLTYKFTDRLSDINTNVSKEALDEFIKNKAFSKYKSIVVYNGIDTEAFRFNNSSRGVIRAKLNVSENDVLLLSVGRLTAAKDYPNLITAFKLLPDNYKLVIVGDGELRTQIEFKIEQEDLTSRVKLLGSIREVYEYYSASDMFILSSKWEGFGLVVAEAMACERIVVSTDAGGIREVIGNLDFLVPTSESEALAEKIIATHNLCPEKKSQIEHNNRQHVIDNFSIRLVVNQWLSIYSINRL